MALRHADFPSGQVGLYGTTEALLTNGVYAQGSFEVTPLVDDPDPNITGTVLRTSNGIGSTFVRWVLPSVQTTVGVGYRLWQNVLPDSSGPSGQSPAMQLRDSGNNILATLWIGTTGNMVFSAGGTLAGAVYAQSAGPVVTANGWYHIESKFVVSATTGSVEVRVEGTTVLSASNINTGATSVAQLSLGTWASGNGGGILAYYKDFIVWDGSGSSNNNFFGTVSVRDLITTADVALNWGLVGAATGAQAVDDFPPDDDTSYIFAVTPPPAASTMNMDDLPADVSSVRGLVIFNRSRKTDGGDGNLQMGLVSGASTALGADRPITTSYTWWTDVVEQDPATSAAWLPAAVNAVQLRFNRTL